jgi:hypothetical protein
MQEMAFQDFKLKKILGEMPPDPCSNAPLWENLHPL